MAVEAYLPSFGVVTFTALVDAINPCAIGVLILMLSVLFAKKKTMRETFFLGMTYILAVYVTYLLAGLGLLYFFSSIPLLAVEYLTLAVSSLIIFAGILEIKDFFWYAKGLTLSIPPRVSRHLPRLSKNTTFFGIAFLGAFVAAVELPCTGAPYLAIITLLSQSFDFNAFLLLIWYNILFVSPLVAILLLSIFGVDLMKIKAWKEKKRALMRLWIGMTLILLGWVLILIANGTINFG